MDLGGQVYHEKIMHAIILFEGNEKIGSLWINLFCGQLDGLAVSLVLEQAYRQKYLTKPIVVTLKGRRCEEAVTNLMELKKEFPQLHVENNWDIAAKLVKDVSKKGLDDVKKRKEEKIH